MPAVAGELASVGNKVEVILRQNARRFVGPASFRGLTLVEGPSEVPEVVLFAPAPPETVARLAHGLESVPAAQTIVAPELDAGTASHPAVRENLRLLREDGRRIVEGPDG